MRNALPIGVAPRSSQVPTTASYLWLPMHLDTLSDAGVIEAFTNTGLGNLTVKDEGDEEATEDDIYAATAGWATPDGGHYAEYTATAARTLLRLDTLGGYLFISLQLYFEGDPSQGYIICDMAGVEGNDNVTYGGYCLRIPTNGQIQFGFRDLGNSSLTNLVNYDATSDAGSVLDIACSINGTSRAVDLYINGTLEDSDVMTGTAPTLNPVSPFTLWATNDQGGPGVSQRMNSGTQTAFRTRNLFILRSEGATAAQIASMVADARSVPNEIPISARSL